MKKLNLQYIWLVFIALGMYQCSPKTAKVIDSGDQTMQSDQVTDIGDFRSKPPSAGPAPVINIGKAQQFKLDNGMTVVVVENHKLPTLSIFNVYR